MLRSLWLTLLYVAFLGLGVITPFVMTLGYVWVDTFRPQEVAYVILNELPVAFIMGAGAVGTYFLLDRRSPPPLTLQSVLQVLLAIWMTISLAWAQVPDAAYEKWDWAFKSMVFAAFVPLVIRSRPQIEAFAQTFVFSLAANFVPFGLKVLISGGGYGQQLGLNGSNTGLGEGGFLSTACLMAVPLILFLGKHGQLIPRLPLMNLAYAFVAILAVVTAVGTYERSALVGIAVLGLWMFVRSRRKLLFGIVLCAATVAFIVGTSGAWNERMASTADFDKESSSQIRLLVWQWTLGFVATHPLGGSFNTYMIDVIEIPGGGIQHGRAFHSIYFEVLGELGFPGLFMFLLAAGSSLISLLRLSSKCRKSPDLIWVADMSDAVQTGILVFLSSATFVGIAFQPEFWYFVSMTVCLRAYVWRVQRSPETAQVGAHQIERRTRQPGFAEAGPGPRLPKGAPGEIGHGPGWRPLPGKRHGLS